MPVDWVGNCPKNNQNLCIKTKPVTVVGDYNGTVLYCIVYIETGRHIVQYTVVSAPAVTGFVFMRRFLGQCTCAV